MSCVQPLLDAAGRRRSPATTPGARDGIARATRASATPQIRRRSMRSSRSPLKPGTIATAIAFKAPIVALWRAGLRIRQLSELGAL